ncbi:MinD-like ATPase involved in chromosome partitioning or flagellar assembly [Nocardia tenerifensis]|uniref:MinD-like ATPase involved in chromosome partitioning or flagellar assembly n=1 Tax=Nocardia tenerifensis TaxID=228006 RepID=A0A318JNU7_9NOCA|nr:hypothetical protein [Nocardia tenerifensis]PXX53451.1 MinD-like ATPase involved in chromosome partitioning or flagellar assembly [Nocardia tenerifensis]
MRPWLLKPPGSEHLDPATRGPHAIDPSTDSEEAELMDNTSAPHSGNDDEEDYTAERPVNLRRQRLRPRYETTSAPEASGTEPEGNERGPSGPYRVEDWSAPAASEQDLAAAREVRLAMVLEPAPAVESEPARWGWRGALNTVGCRFKPSAAGPEVAYRRAVQRIRQPLPGTSVVAVANPKGGSGVTPTTIVLSGLFGQFRGGQVVAWDANEACGTLAARAAVCEGPETVWDVLECARELCSPDRDASALGRLLQRQPTLDEVLASDQTPAGTATLGREECAAIMAVLRRQRTMILIDTGSNERAPAFEWAMETATQLVVPVTGRRDSVVAALRLLDGLAQSGHIALAARAVVVYAEEPGTSSGRALAALDRAGVQRVLTVPFDRMLADGDRIILSRLGCAGVQAWAEVAAAVADGLAEALGSRWAPADTDFVPDSRPGPDPRHTRSHRQLPACGMDEKSDVRNERNMLCGWKSGAYTVDW